MSEFLDWDTWSWRCFQNYKILSLFLDNILVEYTVDHKILTKKLELYGIKGCNLRWFKSYLSNRKQFLTYVEKQTNIESITCGVPQGSILGPLLFLIFVNDLHKVTKYLDPIMFADDTNLFYSHKNIKTLFFQMKKKMFYFIKCQCVILSRRSCQPWDSITSKLKEKILSNF